MREAQSAAKLYAFSGEERGALKMLINAELQRLLNQNPQNGTMIAVFQNILDELKNGRPLS